MSDDEDIYLFAEAERLQVEAMDLTHEAKKLREEARHLDRSYSPQYKREAEAEAFGLLAQAAYIWAVGARIKVDVRNRLYKKHLGLRA